MKYVLLALMLISPLSLVIAGDYKAGEEKSAVCAACHGAGVSANPLWPNIAGQHGQYIVKQLQDYKDGKLRSADTMTAVVQNLSKQDMEDIAYFYAKQPIPEGVTPKEYFKRGQILYRGGDFDKGVMACIACHGPDGRGNEQAGFPLLSGQHAQYTEQQLQSFKDGKRSNDILQIMRDISGRMSADDMRAVAFYISGLH